MFGDRPWVRRDFWFSQGVNTITNGGLMVISSVQPGGHHHFLGYPIDIEI